MNTNLKAVDTEVWHVYRDGGLFKVLSKSAYTAEALKDIWAKEYPGSLITVK